MQAYSDPSRESDPHALPDVEVFHSDDYPREDGEEQLEDGWYWWSCSPGCLPDGDPSGPFETEELALQDARLYGPEDEPEPEDAPAPGDYYITPCGPLGGCLFVGRVMDTKSTPHLGQFSGDNQDEQARAAIRARMELEQFWPNVWYVSDHGNWSLETL